MQAVTLDDTLEAFAAGENRLRADAASTLRALAATAVRMRTRIALGMLEGPIATETAVHGDGDVQKQLDIDADTAFLTAARNSPIAYYASEEREAPLTLNPSAGLALAIDPLDGSSNIDANAAMGTIFSLLPARGARSDRPDDCFLQPGSRQLAAGLFLYGPQLSMMLTLGQGVQAFVYSSRTGAFMRTHDSITIPPEAKEYAINASNWRHWDEGVRLYVEDCLAGSRGPRGRDFNTRWIAAVAGDAQRILSRGGVFLYPGDARPGYADGRLRLLYEAHPLAFLIEQAGGGATDGVRRILDIGPATLHERTPLVFGAVEEVAYIARCLSEPSAIADRSPLFGHRGLFRA
jgi:fructose-1,6-bisphosphatase I